MDFLDVTGSTSPLGTAVQDIAGPFFLGFSFQFLGMGIVLVLSTHYFSTVSSKQKTLAESSRRLGVILVAASLVLNIAQTITDMIRGWDMFAKSFMNIARFLTPGPSYFLSPFFGLLQATITQSFLLRRCLLFISSLSAFWPRLAHTYTRWILGGLMGLMILLSAGAGTAASVMVWKADKLWNLDRIDDVSSGFRKSELIWLTTSSGVDLILSTVLCIELWWARRKLASKGGAMRQVVTRLMLITFHGGFLVTAIQLIALFTYQFAKMSSWSYFPMLSISKVYTITLILSLTLQVSHADGPSPSHVFSLPTITSHHPPSQPSFQPNGHDPVSPTKKDDSSEKEAILKHPTVKRVKSQVQKSWRKSQDWIGWSLVGSPHYNVNKNRYPQTRGTKSKSMTEDVPGHVWSRHKNVSEPDRGRARDPIYIDTRLNEEFRRASDSVSGSPLYNASGGRRPSTVPLLNSSSVFNTNSLSESSSPRQLPYPDHMGYSSYITGPDGTPSSSLRRGSVPLGQNPSIEGPSNFSSTPPLRKPDQAQREDRRRSLPVITPLNSTQLASPTEHIRSSSALGQIPTQNGERQGGGVTFIDNPFATIRHVSAEEVKMNSSGSEGTMRSIQARPATFHTTNSNFSPQRPKRTQRSSSPSERHDGRTKSTRSTRSTQERTDRKDQEEVLDRQAIGQAREGEMRIEDKEDMLSVQRGRQRMWSFEDMLTDGPG